MVKIKHKMLELYKRKAINQEENLNWKKANDCVRI